MVLGSWFGDTPASHLSSREVPLKAVSAIVLSLFGAPFGLGVTAGELPLTPGLYELEIRLELPHLERHAVTRTEAVCIGENARAPVRLPVLTGNDVFRTCPVTNRQWAGNSLNYDITCPGRVPARAKARYTVATDRFDGRIAITLGAKNMTMTEIQRGRRIGDCRPSRTSAPQVGPR